MYRSTKGASKARRDQINAEIRSLKELLPLAEADKVRLSYLHIMSLACIYTRKGVFFAGGAPLTGPAGLLSAQELEDIVAALPGFLLMFTAEGKLLYLSDNVSEHLGHSMVDLVAQGDSIYDIIDPADHLTVRQQLTLPSMPDTDRLFRCRFNTSKSLRRQSAGNKLVLIRGRFHPHPPGAYWAGNPVFTAFCAPLDPRARPGPGCGPGLASIFLAVFQSRHAKDLALLDVSESVLVYLGFERSELVCKSWYGLLHPEDLAHASAQHYRLLADSGDAQTEMVVRLQAKAGGWVWIYSLMHPEGSDGPITANNYPISDSEAWCLRQQLSSEDAHLAYVLGTSTVPATFSESLLSPAQCASPDPTFTPAFGGPRSSNFPTGPELASISSGEQLPPPPKDMDFNYLAFPTGPESTFQGDLCKDFVCTPPYTPHQSGGCAFLFSLQEPFQPHHIPTPSSSIQDQLTPSTTIFPDQLTPSSATFPELTSPIQGQLTDATAQTYEDQLTPCATTFQEQLMPNTATFQEQLASPVQEQLTPPSTAFQTHLTSPSRTFPDQLSPNPTKPYFPQDGCSFLYEKLPPSPNSPGNGDCTLLALAQLRGPLSVDVPLVPDGLLTPEASPVKQSFFHYSEKERSEIDRLIQQISQLAQGMDCPFPAEPGAEGLDPLGQSLSFPGAGPPIFSLDLKSWKSQEVAFLDAPEDQFLEEKSVEDIFMGLSAPTPQGDWGPGGPEASGPGGAPSPCTDLSPEDHSFLEDLAAYETDFETGVSAFPCDGCTDELYQLQSRVQDSFHDDGSGGEPTF